jgi:hypothetical protein
LQEKCGTATHCFSLSLLCLSGKKATFKPARQLLSFFSLFVAANLQRSDETSHEVKMIH